MRELKAEQLKKLIVSHQWNKARILLEEFFHRNLTQKEEDNSILKKTSLYLEATNSLSRQHLEILDNALVMLKNTDKQQKSEEDGIDLDIARSQIKQS